MIFQIILVFAINLLTIIGVCRCYQNGFRVSRQNIPPSASIPSINAVFLECPKELKYKPYFEDYSKPPNTCEPQLIVNIRVNPSFHVERVKKFLILDEVYYPRKRTKAKLMAPYLIELSRGEPVMMYPLEFTKSVNVDDDPEHKLYKSYKNCDYEKSDEEKNKKLPKSSTSKPTIAQKLTDQNAAKNIYNTQPSKNGKFSRKQTVTENRIGPEQESANRATQKVNWMTNYPIKYIKKNQFCKSENPLNYLKKTSMNMRTKAASQRMGNGNLSESVQHETPNEFEKTVDWGKILIPSPFSYTKTNPYKNIGLTRNEVMRNLTAQDNLARQLYEIYKLRKFEQILALPRITTFPKNGEVNDMFDQTKKKILNYYDSYKNPSIKNSKHKNNMFGESITKGVQNRAMPNKPELFIDDDKLINLPNESIIEQKLGYLLSDNENWPRYRRREYSNYNLNTDNKGIFPLAKLNKNKFLNPKRQIYFKKASPNIWQEVSYSQSIVDSSPTKSTKIPNATDHGLDDADVLKATFKNILRKRSEDTLKPEYTNLYLQFNSSPVPVITNENFLNPYKTVPSYGFNIKHGSFDDNTTRYENDVNYFRSTEEINGIKDFIDLYESSTSFLSETEKLRSLGMPSYSMSLKANQKANKQKRSFLFYDDMEMVRNLNDDKDFDEQPLPQEEFTRIYDGAQPCATCGGKGKKAPGKGDSQLPFADSSIENCKCPNECRNTCFCDSNKLSRSVTDAWYSVYDMSAPLPFLATKLRIFQKRHGAWCKIKPSITLNSLSGIFANANLSILLSSHVDIFQLKKSLRIQNHQLFVPTKERPTRENKIKYNTDSFKANEEIKKLNLDPEKILAIDSTNLTLTSKFLKFLRNDLFDKQWIPQSTYLSNEINNLITNPRKTRNIDNKTDTNIRKIAELGYFPTTMNVLEMCPNNKSRLCLNMLDDIVPGFTIKMKMPFRQNALIINNIFNVKIAQIISDATTKDALQVSVYLINEGFEPREFSVSVSNCPTVCSTTAKTSVVKFLLPHVGETINYLLPLILEANNQNHKKFYCEVVVKTITSNNSDYLNKLNLRLRQKRNQVKTPQIENEQKELIIAVRQLIIEPENRCFCVWKCRCHCVPKLETNIDYNICQELDLNSESKAGLLLNSISNSDSDGNLVFGGLSFSERSAGSKKYFKFSGGFLWNALLLLLLMILLGFLKASLGICIKSVDKWGYDYVQPCRSYYKSSKWRRFWVNASFFITFPFLIWCKCFTPSEEDLLVASTEWSCHNYSVFKHRPNTHKFLSNDEDEDIILSQNIHCQSKKTKKETLYKDKSQNFHTLRDTDDENGRVYLLKNNDGKSSKGISEKRLVAGENLYDSSYDIHDLDLSYNEDIFDDDEEANTKFVLKALAESRESLKKLQLNNRAISLESISEERNLLMNSAEEFVQKLKAAQIVYRTFDQPVGNLKNIPPGFKYCIQGYFLPSTGDGYEFVNYNPLTQHRGLSIDGKTLQALRPPNLLCPKNFSRRYVNKYEVLKMEDLTIHPSVPCINISSLAAIATSIAKLAMDQSTKSDMVISETDQQEMPLQLSSLKDTENLYLIQDMEPINNDVQH